MAIEDETFIKIAIELKDNRSQIVSELKLCQGKSVDVGGYYQFDDKKVNTAMRPSPTFNKILDKFYNSI